MVPISRADPYIPQIQETATPFSNILKNIWTLFLPWQYPEGSRRSNLGRARVSTGQKEVVRQGNTRRGKLSENGLAGNQATAERHGGSREWQSRRETEVNSQRARPQTMGGAKAEAPCRSLRRMSNPYDNRGEVLGHGRRGMSNRCIPNLSCLVLKFLSFVVLLSLSLSLSRSSSSVVSFCSQAFLASLSLSLFRSHPCCLFYFHLVSCCVFLLPPLLFGLCLSLFQCFLFYHCSSSCIHDFDLNSLSCSLSRLLSLCFSCLFLYFASLSLVLFHSSNWPCRPCLCECGLRFSLHKWPLQKGFHAGSGLLGHSLCS